MELYAAVRRTCCGGASPAARRCRPRDGANDAALPPAAWVSTVQKPIRCPKLEAFTGVIDQIFCDQHRPKKQRHTAKRICERLRASTTSPLSNLRARAARPGDVRSRIHRATATDFGEAWWSSTASNARTTCVDLPHSDGVRAGHSGGERRRSAMGTTLRSTTSAACRVAVYETSQAGGGADAR